MTSANQILASLADDCMTPYWQVLRHVPLCQSLYTHPWEEVTWAKLTNGLGG